jgi:3'(2'), 5'-bisphosphate nucleotidase
VSSQQTERLADRLETILHALGRLLLEWRGGDSNIGRWEACQFKCEADRHAHNFLEGHLREQWPSIPVISEEDPQSQRQPRPSWYWLIDPIDGTASYCEGFSGFVTQVALMEAQRPKLGLIHAPALSLTYRCIGGSVPMRNRKPITVADDREHLTLIDNYPQPRGIARALCDALEIHNYLESGSIALKICRVADGTADLFVKDVVVRDWDLAAAQVVLEGAGGTMSNLDGEPITYIGGMEKLGLVAAASTQLAGRVHHFRQQQREVVR